MEKHNEWNRKNTHTKMKECALDGTPFLAFPGLSSISCIKHLFSTRMGGVSEGIWTSMNLSFTRGDNPEAVLENYRRIVNCLGTTPDKVVCSDQTHTTNIRVVSEEDAGKGVVRKKDYSDIDGLITNVPGIVLATFYADCVPLYFVDPVQKVIGLAHSGWRGTADRMGQCMVTEMERVYGCDRRNIHAAIGPSICMDCYEVSADVAEVFLQMFSITKEQLRSGESEVVRLGRLIGNTGEQKYQLNLWEANRRILLEAGVQGNQIEVTDLCTCCNSKLLFSHRASMGKRGNLGAFLMLS